MEAFLFQWDKACDAMPLLRPFARILAFLFIFILVFSILPSMFMPENYHRPDPLKRGTYTSAQLTYLEGSNPVDPAQSYHNVDVPSLEKVLTPAPVATVNSVEPAQVQDVNIVRQKFEGGIGHRRKNIIDGEEGWDYHTQVAYIIETGFEENTFKIDTGIFVDTRNLHETGNHRQLVTVKAPSKGYNDLKNFPVTVTTLRDIVTQCIYYSMEIFGKRRLVLGGDNGKIDSGC